MIDFPKLTGAALMLNNSICEQIEAHENEVAVITLLARNRPEGGLEVALSANVTTDATAAILNSALTSVLEGNTMRAEVPEEPTNGSFNGA